MPEEKRATEFRGLLEKITPPDAISQAPDPKSTREEEDLENQKKKAVLTGLRQDIDERKKYAGRTFALLIVWLSLIGLVVFIQGYRLCGFDLSNSVLITLIGSTTGSVVGIFLIVTRYLFRDH